MHRLLSYKGYHFPEVRRDDVAVLNPSDGLKSAEEMEEEEREAQSAKLQELIRRGAPEDLQEANRLMKIMAGYDTRSKTDYRAKAAEEVGKIQAKARLLEERLAAFQPGDTMADGDVFEDLAASLQSAQPKIQKNLLEINDSIHRTVERWKMLKKGDIEGANKLAQGAPIPTPSTASGKAKSSAAAELSLIDFDADVDIPGPALLSSLTQNSTAKGPTPTPTPPPFSPYSGFTSKPSASQSTTPQPPLGQYSAFSQPPQKTSDPFAALSAAQFASKPSTPQPPAVSAAANDDDEWSFSSALPPEASSPRDHQVVVSNTLLRINMKAVRAPQVPHALSLLFSFSNTSPQQIGDLHFQLAVTKGYELKLQPQTGRILQPNQDNGVTQVIQVWHAGDTTRKVDSARLRWRVSYNWGAETKAETGEIPEFSIA
ncbi:hypothetical protein ONZ43_g6790 [Nemania bipapillata]|uniref:Uncharacterized protein n=1 Tax=Nemania bipapillata TaxID=110536 RepID=A0ACC2HX27_9PEZI|nr:hypothetical protein ONZ43_g6790 [Nemania bipapillata]